MAARDKVRSLVIASSSVLPVPADACVGWGEYADRTAAQGPDLQVGQAWRHETTRAEAIRTAPTNLWNPEALPDSLARLGQVRFSSDWARPWKVGVLPDPRLERPVEALAATGISVLLLHGEYDMTFPRHLVDQTLVELPGSQAVGLRDAGHMAHVGQPVSWISAVEDFLRQRDPVTHVKMRA